jgi:hypothetical protein
MALKASEKYAKQVREHGETLVNSPVEFEYEVPALDDESVRIFAVGEYVFLETSGNTEVRFDRDALITLRQKLDAAFQRVA